MRTCIGLLTALIVVASAVGPADAGETTERVRAFFGDVNRVIADPAYDAHPDERLGALRGLVADIVDFRNAAAIALGSEWAARSTGEREDFVRAFTALLETSVFASVGSRARLDNGISVTYLAEVADGETATVATTVLTRSDRELSVDYRMAHRQGRWVVHDVWLDGVSLVENYRAQFQKVMQRSSYAELLTEMRSRIAELGRPVTPPIVVTPAPAVDIPRPSVAIAILALARPVADPRIDLAREMEPPRAPAVSEPPLIAASAEPPRAQPASERPYSPAHVSQFWVQVGAFRSEDKAIQVATALRDQTVSLFTVPNDPLLRVVVGPFANRDAAVSKLREIRARGYDAFIPAVKN